MLQQVDVHPLRLRRCGIRQTPLLQLIDNIRPVAEVSCRQHLPILRITFYVHIIPILHYGIIGMQKGYLYFNKLDTSGSAFKQPGHFYCFSVCQNKILKVVQKVVTASCSIPIQSQLFYAVKYQYV